ncbi:EF-P 5-aminopentanol modification-associated protein YfmH [Caenibacillus caldisaponilyticus]|uniref:EF-P 5-aminopentanol modification-associated protein YfmH n=1 Tax=Caenibacillus caldisaponilyticus TaxID=1674942 RepID=UPI0009885B0F|nr:pitrilysin family protein [Caenibacillus caldisaponilyticus]
MEIQRFDRLQETVYREVLPNGLTVCVLPKKGFQRTYATFATKYGSIDNHFKSLTSKNWVRVPDGIAHFLEHKLFEQPDGTDVFHAFSRQGAEANAYTTFTRTTYLFSSTANVEKNVETLIDFVQTPAFTDQSVEKEKGIIGQEIRMYNDTPDWRVYFGLIENMYHAHPVKIDIAGTIESIAQITKESLYECYHTFYHPGNMVLFIVGPVDPERMIHLVAENQARKNYTKQAPVERRYPEEPAGVAKAKSVLKMGVETPKSMVGFKAARVHRSGQDYLKHELSVQILLELLFGKSSDNYRRLIDEKLIDESFSFEYTEEHEYGFSAIGGNTEDPDRLAARLFEMIMAQKERPIPEEALERARKKRLGSFLKALNSPEYIANQYTRYLFNGANLFDIVAVLEDLRAEELEAVLHEHFDERAFTQCQVVRRA